MPLLLRVEDPVLERTLLELLVAADFTTDLMSGITRPLSDDRLLLLELVTALTDD